MLTKNTIALAVAAVMTLGVASAAQASDHENQSGGYRIGPLGQHFGPVRGPAFGFAYAPRWYDRGDFAYMPRHHRMWHYGY